MTTLSRLLVLCLAVVCGARAAFDLQHHVTYQWFGDLAQLVSEGRAMPGDAEFVEPRLAELGPVGCHTGAARDVALAELYVADLSGLAQTGNPIGVSTEPEILSARERAMERVQAALSCAPLDGDLWLRGALVARAMEREDVYVAELLAFSEQTMPHEQWVRVRREAFFPEMAPETN